MKTALRVTLTHVIAPALLGVLIMYGITEAFRSIESHHTSFNHEGVIRWFRLAVGWGNCLICGLATILWLGQIVLFHQGLEPGTKRFAVSSAVFFWAGNMAMYYIALSFPETFIY